MISTLRLTGRTHLPGFSNPGLPQGTDKVSAVDVVHLRARAADAKVREYAAKDVPPCGGPRATVLTPPGARGVGGMTPFPSARQARDLPYDMGPHQRAFLIRLASAPGVEVIRSGSAVVLDGLVRRLGGRAAFGHAMLAPEAQAVFAPVWTMSRSDFPTLGARVGTPALDNRGTLQFR